LDTKTLLNIEILLNTKILSNIETLSNTKTLSNIETLLDMIQNNLSQFFMWFLRFFYWIQKLYQT